MIETYLHRFADLRDDICKGVKTALSFFTIDW